MKYSFIIIKTLLLTILIGSTSDISAQRSSEYIYGKVTTKSKEQYIGYIRWGKEEFLWHDVFNSEKIRSRRIKSPNEKPSSLWDNFSWNLSSIWEDKYSTTTHLFSCFFGDIKAIYPRGNDKLDLEIKNGTIIKLDGNSNDVGTQVNVYDFELGKVKISWKKISKIEFSDGPYNEFTDFGQPLYGTVKTHRKGEFTGYIKWDLHERTTEDILDGDNGNDKIAFKNIKSIYKRDHGVDVILNSDRDIYLTGSNDVNSQNNGIGIFVEGVGNIEVGWSDFKSLHLFENKNEGMSYSDFEVPIGMPVEIVTYDDEHEGLMVFDIDEKWEMEFVDAKDDKVSFQIPFYYIDQIKPKNKTFSMLKLKNGEVLLLGEGHDLSSSNDGILLFNDSSDEPQLIKWRDLVEINLK